MDNALELDSYVALPTGAGSGVGRAKSGARAGLGQTEWDVIHRTYIRSLMRKLSVVADRFDSCQDTGYSQQPFRKRRSGSTVRMPGSYGTWHANSIYGGIRVAVVLRASGSSVANCPKRERHLAGWLMEASSCSSRPYGISLRQWRSSSMGPMGGHRGARPGGMMGSGWWRSDPATSGELAGRPGVVWVPKAGWIRFRWSQPVPGGMKSYRVTCDRAGRWHVAFAVPPEPILGPGSGRIVGVNLGVAVSAALSTGELLRAPRLSRGRQRRMRSASAQVDPGHARLQPSRAYQDPDRPAACQADRHAQGLVREDLHEHRPAVRLDLRRRYADPEHDSVGQGQCPKAGQERKRQKSGLEQGDPRIRLGQTDSPSGR